MVNNRDFSGVKTYNGQAAPVKKDTVSALQEMLATNMKALTSVLPKHITPERMARVSISTVRRTPDLMKCAPATIFMGILEASTLGLELDSRGLAYLVPYWNSKTGTYDAQFQIGYKGLIALAHRSGKIKSIQAGVVGENDKFDYALGLNPRLEHIPNLKNKGEIIAAYAIAIMKDGAVQFEVMSKNELDKIREKAQAKSKNKNSGPWAEWTEEMQKKTVIKRLCKFLPLSPEIQRAVSMDDQADAGITQSLGEMIDEAIIDIPASESVTENQEAEPEKEEQPKPEPQTITQEELIKQADNSYSFECPKNEKTVTEEACKECDSRKGCQVWEV